MTDSYGPTTRAGMAGTFRRRFQFITLNTIQPTEFIHKLAGHQWTRLREDLAVSRHKSVDTLHAYMRDADAFRDHAGSGLL
jgi:hypothetical protein